MHGMPIHLHIMTKYSNISNKKIIIYLHVKCRLNQTENAIIN